MLGILSVTDLLFLASTMQAIGISIVKNEADIIESFVRHNLQFLDGIVIFDNRSTDSTRLILKMLMREGLPVCLCDDYEYAYLQSEKMTNLLKRVSSAIPVDFIIPLDADELIECQNYDEFETILSSIEPSGIGFCPWKTYVLSPELANSQSKTVELDRFSFCRDRELPQYYKVILRNSNTYIDDLVLAQGSHEIISGYDLPKTKLANISLAHFPVRSKAQILKKAVFGELAYQIRDSQQKTQHSQQGYQWRSLFQRLMSGGELSGSELVNISLNYAQAPSQLGWPENVRHSKFCLSQFSSLYQELATSDILTETIKSFRNYVTGIEYPFNPNEYYKVVQKSEQCDEKTCLESTAFDPNWHFENLYLDIPPFKYLYERFLPSSAIDVGCGSGHYLKLLNNLGTAQILGLDGTSPQSLYIPPEHYIQHDLHQSFDCQKKFDLVICCEVAEHLNPGSEEILISNLEDHANHIILFSAAAPDQPGHGHINCKPFSFWAEQWATRGWVPMVFETLCFRALSTFSWFRRNPVIMTRSDDESDALASWLALILISEEDYIYKPQSPGIVINPLSTHFPLG